MHPLLKITLLSLTISTLGACAALNPTKETGAPDTAEAEQQLETVLEHQQRAHTAYAAADWKTAAESYEILVEQLPNKGEHWFRLGNAYARLQRPEEAILAYRRAINRDPSNSKIWHNLGLVQLREASKTFIEMQEFIDQDDPLAVRGRYVIDAMADIMQKGFGAKIEESDKE